MNKSGKKRKIGVASVLVILAIVVGGYFLLKPIIEQSGFGECTGGLSILSADITPESNHPVFGNRPYLRITATANQQGECARVRISPDQVNNLLEGGTIDNTVTIDSRNNGEMRRWTVSGTNEFYNNLNLGVKANLLSCTEQKCRENGFPTTQKAKTIEDFPIPDCGCVYTSPAGEKGNINIGALRILDYDIIASGIGTGHISTIEETSTRIGNLVFVKWTGNLVTNYILGDLGTNYNARKPINTWQLIKKDANQNYNVILNDVKACLDRYPAWNLPTRSETQACIDNGYLEGGQNKLNSDTYKQRNTEFVANEQFVENLGVEGNIFLARLTQNTAFPVFTIDIDGEYMGIEFTEGEPDVTCPGKMEVGTGDSILANFIVKNVGDSNGNFNLFLKCGNNPLAVTPGTVSLSPNQQTQATGLLTGTNTEEDKITIQCNFRAVDPNFGNEDSCSVSLDILPGTTCGVVGNKVCSNDLRQIMECRQNGLFEPIQNCDVFCGLVDGTPTCLTDEQAQNQTQAGECNPVKVGALTILPSFTGSKTQEIGFDTFLGHLTLIKWETACFGLFQALVFILALAGGIIISILTFNLLKKSKTLPKFWVSILPFIALLLAYIVILNYFWYGLIFAVIFILIIYFTAGIGKGLKR